MRSDELLAGWQRRSSPAVAFVPETSPGTNTPAAGSAAMKLRDYQERDVERLREAMRSSRRVLYVAPTGSGKTVLFAAIAEGAAVKGKRVVVLVHRIELVKQTVEKLAAFGVAAGLITAQRTERL